jgi:hypothetical protein
MKHLATALVRILCIWMIFLSIQNGAYEIKAITQQGQDLIVRRVLIRSYRDLDAINQMLLGAYKGYKQEVSKFVPDSAKENLEVDEFLASMDKARVISQEWMDYLNKLDVSAREKTAVSFLYSMLGFWILFDVVFWIILLFFSRKVAEKLCWKLEDEINPVNGATVMIRLIGLMMFFQLALHSFINSFIEVGFVEILVRSFIMLSFLALMVWSRKLAALACWRIK